MYDTKDNDYFRFTRHDIAPLLPEFSSQVLELGCGEGSTLAWLKRSGRAGHTTGMELCAEPAALARSRVDKLIEGDLCQGMAELPEQHYDLVLCLDVLEHLVDPWGTAARVNRLLKPGGRMIVSLPNVRHHSVVLPLLFNGRWRYEEAGIMDRTHLRFFSREGARELLVRAGMGLIRTIDVGLAPTRRREAWKSLLGQTPLRDLGVFQFLMLARKPLKMAGAATS